MAMFSERYGYVNVSDVIIREKITPEIQMPFAHVLISWSK